MVQLTGSPEQIGAEWGALNRNDIVAHMQEFLRMAREQHGLGEPELVERSQVQARIISQLAPHWLDEAGAIADAAGVPADLYLAWQYGKARGIIFGEDCTSYAAVGSAPADGRPLFHKNRDNVIRPQAFYRKETLAPGVLPFISVGDTSDTGVMMMVNAAGLAGSADMAGPDPDPYYAGLMNSHGLRHIAEHARTCGEALEIVRMMNDRGWYAGAKIATNWAFADATGEAMIIYNAHARVEVTAQTRDGHVQTVEREGLRELLEARRGKLLPKDFNAASRLPGVCMPGNCSSLTVQIDPERPDLLSCAWAALGKADQCGYFPLYMGATATPDEYADGRVFDYGLQGLPLLGWQEFEDQAERGRVPLEAQARREMTKGNETEARRLLTGLAGASVRAAEKRMRRE